MVGIMNMNDIKLKMAKLDQGSPHKQPCPKYGYDIIPDYPNDHKAVQRVIDDLNDYDSAQFVRILSDMVGEYSDWATEDVVSMFKAPLMVKIEAILRATGEWK